MSQYPSDQDFHNYNYDPSESMPSASTRSSGGSSSKWLWIILGVSGFGFLACCGLCGGVGVWTIRTAMREEAKAAQQSYKDHPIVIEQLGGIDSCEPNYMETLDDHETDSVFDVVGPKGKGEIRTKSFFDEIYSAKLITDQGEWELEEEETIDDEMESPTEIPQNMEIPLNLDLEYDAEDLKNIEEILKNDPNFKNNPEAGEALKRLIQLRREEALKNSGKQE